MHNVLQFTPRQETTKLTDPEQVAPDKCYWLQDIQLATHYAAFIDHDMRAVTLLMQVQLDFMTRGTSLDKIPEKVRRDCSKYLVLPEDVGEKTKKIEAIVRAVYAGWR